MAAIAIAKAVIANRYITDVPYFLRKAIERVRLISFFIFFPSLFLAELMQKLSECARYTQSGNAKSLV